MWNSSFGSAADIFSELNRLQGVLDQVFRPPERSGIRTTPGAAFPPMNVGTTADAVEVLALAPGLDPAKLQVTVDRGLLTIAGERASGVPEGDGTTVYGRERFTGSFRRVLSLPADADPAKVDATYRDGVLRITVGKHASSKPVRIEIH